jgi:hypothetical protein
MGLIFREAHAAPDKKKLNEEYFVLENNGGVAVSTGFMLQPGEKIIVVSGVPGKKAHGDPPTRDGMRVYHLLQRESLLQGTGTTIRLALNQMEIARLEYDAAKPDGIAAADAS